MTPKKWLMAGGMALIFVLLALTGRTVRFDIPAAMSDNAVRREKLSWLEEHPGAYDTYVLASAAGGVYDLGEGAWNMAGCCGKTAEYAELAGLLLAEHGAKHIVLALGPEEAEDTLPETIFSSLDGDTGCWDSALRDVEKVGDPEAYRREHGAAFAEPSAGTLSGIEDCAAMVEEIKALCRRYGAELTVILSPVYGERWARYEEEELRAYMTALAQVTDYWDFSYTPLSSEERYFYDAGFFRSAVGDMVWAVITGDESLWRPEDFGTVVTADTCQTYLDGLFSTQPSMESHTIDVPILMYHHLTDEVTGDTHITPATFEAHMTALREAGYTAVTFQELVDYVYHGGTLPERPVCITLDDGYRSNYDLAWPILERLGMRATVFAIGVSVGKEYYKDTQYAMTPHFGYDEAREMLESGVMDFQSHTYDMHQWAPFESGEYVREAILPFDHESEQAYAAVLRADMAAYEAIRIRELGEGFVALAYPGGRYNERTEVLIHEAGIPVTVSTDLDRRNVLVRGLPQSLYALCRPNITEETTVQELLAYVADA